ncbi:cation transporter [Euzebya tangerina]|uniref:cation transporter n=1 Tax=Euzebya tangerina TaxID=591198 RepID=UPI0013C2B7B0
MAETLHSVADSGNEVLLLLGARRARQQPSAIHPFGRGRERYFWASWSGWCCSGSGVSSRSSTGPQDHRQLRRDHQSWTGDRAYSAGTDHRGAVTTNRQPRGQPSLDSLGGTGGDCAAYSNPEVIVVLLEDGPSVVVLPIAMSGIGATWGQRRCVLRCEGRGVPPQDRTLQSGQGPHLRRRT